MAVTKMTMVISAKDNTNPPMAVGWPPRITTLGPSLSAFIMAHIDVFKVTIFSHNCMELRIKLLSYVVLACKKSRPRNHSWGSRPVIQHQYLVELNYHHHSKHLNLHQYHNFHLYYWPDCHHHHQSPRWPSPPLPDLVERSCFQPPGEPWCHPQVSSGHSRGHSGTGGGEKVEIENFETCDQHDQTNGTKLISDFLYFETFWGPVTDVQPPSTV